MTAISNARQALRWIMGAAFVLGAWACEQASSGGGPSSAAGSGGSGLASSSGAGGGSASSGFWLPDASAGAGGPSCAPDASPDSPDPPATPCDPAMEAGACDLPPSVCANTEWLTYYSNPQCINGFCHWDKKTTCCSPPFYCTNGGCQGNFTK